MTTLGIKYIPYTYMEPLRSVYETEQTASHPTWPEESDADFCHGFMALRMNVWSRICPASVLIFWCTKATVPRRSSSKQPTQDSLGSY